MKTISFTKMHALGNDFVLIDARSKMLALTREERIQLADRHLGIGCDQLLMLTSSISEKSDVHCEIYNQDGSEAEQCGNGLRCAARFLSQEKKQNTFQISVKAGVFLLEMLDDEHVRMNMGKLFSEPHTVLLQADVTAHEVNVGNPHALIEREEPVLITAELTALAEKISAHPHFKNGANVGFLHGINEHEIILRTFERGSGWTLSCGSNATAAAFYFFHKNPSVHELDIHQPLGHLHAVKNKKGEIELTGSTAFVFQGNISI